MRLVLVLLVALAACAPLPEEPLPETPSPAPQAPPPVAAPEPPPPPARMSDNVAVAGLVETARAESSAGRLSTAAAAIERALRIEPRNPRLWQELARVRLQQRQFAQAESVAARSNSWAGSDPALRAENWRLIAEAREARGDAAGALAARDAADKLSR